MDTLQPALRCVDLLTLQRRLIASPTWTCPSHHRQALVIEHLQHPSGLVEHQWRCLETSAESVHALEQRLRAASSVRGEGDQSALLAGNGLLSPLPCAAAHVSYRPWRAFSSEAPPSYNHTVCLGQGQAGDCSAAPDERLWCLELWVCLVAIRFKIAQCVLQPDSITKSASTCAMLVSWHTYEACLLGRLPLTQVVCLFL